MATYFDDFDYSASAALGDQADWTPKVAGTTPVTAVADGAGVLTMSSGSHTWGYWINDTNGSALNDSLDVVAKFKLSTVPSNGTDWANRSIGPCFASAAATPYLVYPSWYGGAGNENKWILFNGVAQSYAGVSSAVADSTAGLTRPVANQYMWARLRRENTNVYKFRCWQDGDSEPTDWGITYTASLGANYENLYPAIGNGSPTVPTVTFDKFGGAIGDGEVAPVSAGGASVTPIVMRWRM